MNEVKINSMSILGVAGSVNWGFMPSVRISDWKHSDERQLKSEEKRLRKLNKNKENLKIASMK